MALTYGQIKSGNKSSGKSGGTLSYSSAKKAAEPNLEKIKKQLTEIDTAKKRADTFKQNYDNAVANAQKFAEEAAKAEKTKSIWESIAGFPKEAAKQILRIPVSLGKGIVAPFSKENTSNIQPVNIPGFGPIESYQQSVGRTAKAYKEGSATGAQLAGELAQPVIDIASTIYTPAKAGLGALGIIRGGKLLQGAVTAGKAIVPTMGAQFAADAAKEGKSASEIALEAAKGGAVGAGMSLGLGIGGLAVKAGAGAIEKGIAKFFRKDATVQEQILVKQNEIKSNPQKFIDEQAGKPKDPVTFISTRKDLEVVPANSTTDKSGNVVGTHLEWNPETKTGKLYVTPDAKPDSIAQEIGNYIERRYPELTRKTEGKFTEKEISSYIDNLKKNPVGREVSLNGQKAKVLSGNKDVLILQLEDGTKKTVKPSKVDFQMKRGQIVKEMTLKTKAAKEDIMSNAIRKEVEKIVPTEGSTLADAVREVLINPEKAPQAPVIVKAIEDAGLDVPGIIGKSAKENYAASKAVKKPSGYAEDVKAKALEREMKDAFKGVAEYTPAVRKEQAAIASKLINEDRNRVMRILSGTEELPNGLKGASLAKAVEMYAFKKNDSALLTALVKSKISTAISEAGSELSMLVGRNKYSPVKVAQDIVKARSEGLKKRLGDKKVSAAKKEVKEEIKKVIEKSGPKKETWASFIEDIKC